MHKLSLVYYSSLALGCHEDPISKEVASDAKLAASTNSTALSQDGASIEQKIKAKQCHFSSMLQVQTRIDIHKTNFTQTHLDSCINSKWGLTGVNHWNKMSVLRLVPDPTRERMTLPLLDISLVVHSDMFPLRVRKSWKYADDETSEMKPQRYPTFLRFLLHNHMFADRAQLPLMDFWWK